MVDYLNEVALAEKIAKPKDGDCPYTLFLGAGASASSGILTSYGMVNTWKNLLYKSLKRSGKIKENKFEDWEQKGYEEWKNEQRDPYQSDYSLLFSHFYQEPKERQLCIEQEIEGKKPTFGYLFLAGLISSKRFNRVLTTNFDDLLSDALLKYYDVKPIVCAFDSAVAGIRVASQRPKIIKLHGDFLYDNIKNMSHELKSLDANMEQKMYELCKDSGLVVVGYDGNDESIMAPLRDMIRKAEYLNMGLHWCLHAPYGELPTIPKKLQEIINYYGSKVHLYLIQSFDVLMEELFRACKCELPKVLTDPHKNSITQEFYKSVNIGSSSIKSEFMKTSLNEFLEKANKQIESIEYNVMLADIKWELGAEARKKSEAYNKMNDSANEKKEFEKAKTLFCEGYQLINKYFQEDYGNTTDNNLKLLALRRKSGLCIALAKVEKKANLSKFKEFLNEAIDTIKKGIKFYKSFPKNSFDSKIVELFSYNGCCAYSLLAEAEKEINEDTKENIFTFLNEIKELDPEGANMLKISKDSDFRYIKENMSKEIKTKIKSWK